MMNGHAGPRTTPLSYEEKAALLEEKSVSDIESDAGRADFESRFAGHKQALLSTAQSCASHVRSLSWRPLVLRTAIFLLPSFVQSRLSHDPRLRSSGVGLGGDRVGPTAYLDGMRGLAALFVFFCHYLYTCFVIAEGWGYGDDNYSLLKLPFIRLFYQGPPMVCIFFVISGYALSLKPLKLARTRSWDGFATTMTSFVFRRAIRLFAPTAASTLLVVLLLRAGLYEWTRDVADDDDYMRNVHELHYRRFSTASEQLRDWGHNMFNFVHVWSWENFGGSTGYDLHLWTIPVEFRCSMVLFLALVGTARLRVPVRLLAIGVLGWFAYANQRWELVLFLCGTVLAELDLVRGAHSDPATTATVPVSPVATVSSPSSSSSSSFTSSPALLYLPLLGTSTATPRSSPRTNNTSRIRHAAWVTISIIALYLLSQPDQGGESTPGWTTLTALVPSWWDDKYRYWQSVGAALFVAAVARLPEWQRVFNIPPIQYLGRISYAIYLMHGPVLHTVGYAAERAAWRVTGTEGSGYVWGFALASVVVIPAVVWAADVFWRAVDAPVVRFAKWLEVKCSVSE